MQVDILCEIQRKWEYKSVQSSICGKGIYTIIRSGLYEKTFAPVGKLNSVRVIFSLAANLDWSLHQLDIKNVFLNGKLEEEVCMQIPLGLESINTSNMVCRLQKSLYGLEQSLRA